MEKRNIITIGFLLVCCSVFFVLYKRGEFKNQSESDLTKTDVNLDTVNEEAGTDEVLENPDTTSKLKQSGIDEYEPEQEMKVTNDIEEPLNSTTMINAETDAADQTDNQAESVSMNTEEENTYTAKVITHALNVRRSPLQDAAVVLILAEGDEVTVYDTDEFGWCRVKYDDTEGYVFEDFIQKRE